MKNGMLFPQKSTWRSRLDLEYLDEKSERKQSQRSSMEHSPAGRKLKQFADYASKETIGQVHAGGFLHHLILVNPDGSRSSPLQLSNSERKRRISSAWFNHIQKFPTSSDNPVIQHRLVFSMSTPFHDRLVEAGISPDQVLQVTMKKVMRKFNEQFHPHDTIGYAYGIHHDTDNLHVHVALCPRTAKGAYVGCSMSRTQSSGNKNQMAYLKKCFVQETERWSRSLDAPEKLQDRLSQRIHADKLLFAPRLTNAHLEALRHAQTAEAVRLQQSYQSIRNLEAAIATKRQILLAKKNSRFIAQFTGRKKSKLVHSAEKLAAKVEHRSLREMQALLFKIKRGYRAAHKRYSKTYGFNSYAARSTQSLAPRQAVQKL